MGNRSTCCQPESPTGSTGRRVAPDFMTAPNNNHNHNHHNNNNNNNNRSRNSSSSKKYQYSNNTNYSTTNNSTNNNVNYMKGGGGGANHDNTVSSGYLSGYHHYASRDMDEMSSTWTRDETSNNLQHISEREPDDIDQDPSTHPTKGPLFMERSKSEIRIRDNRISMYFLQNHSAAIACPPSSCSSTTTAAYNGHKLIKSSSCSTIFLDDSTISQPNLRNTIKCISLAIYYHISNRKNRGNERLMDIFEERKHPIMSEPLSLDYELKDPEHKQIYRFIRVLFTSAQLTAECAIITLVYIERLLTYAEIDLCPSNWRRVVLGAIMLASKVWDDQAVWNVDYCQILRRCTVDDMNELERQFLECLEFNINVPSSVYAKYYFDLRTLAIANDMQMPLQPLYKERAKKLEALSKLYEDRYSDTQKKPRRRCNSADRLNNGNLKSPVVIP